MPTPAAQTTETVYAITALTQVQATAAQLAAAPRGHWLIEDRPHGVRDWDENRGRRRSAARCDP